MGILRRRDNIRGQSVHEVFEFGVRTRKWRMNSNCLKLLLVAAFALLSERMKMDDLVR